MSLLRRILTLIFAGLLFQSNLAAAAMRPMMHAGADHPAAVDTHDAGAGDGQHLNAMHDGMPAEREPGSPAHECDGVPTDCAIMSVCSTPAMPTVPSLGAPCANPAPVVVVPATSAPASRSLPPDVPPPRS